MQALATSFSVNKVIQDFGTPVYIYSQAIMENNWKIFYEALHKHLTFAPPIIAFAVKANSHLAILNLLVKWGARFDVVSEGELQRVLRAGGTPEKIFFSGVGKTEKEILTAIQLGIGCIHVESIEELERIERLAGKLKKLVSVALRINPNVDPKTHPYIATGLKENKFGIALEDAKKLYRKKYSYVQFKGIACHIGSQIFELEPYLEALASLLALYDELAQEGLVMEHLDLGGGFGIRYIDEKPFDMEVFAKAVADAIGNRPLTIMVEPGRYIVGNAGILVTKIEYLKDNEEKHFAIVDAGMNDLLRPALYEAEHPVWLVDASEQSQEQERGNQITKNYDIVGPICETGDFLAKDQLLPAEIKSGDYLIIGMTGAYGFSMSSHYNSRPKAAEVLVNGDKIHLIRARETFEDLVRGEKIPE